MSPTIAPWLADVFTASAQLDYRPAGISGRRLSKSFGNCSDLRRLMLASLSSPASEAAFSIANAHRAGDAYDRPHVTRFANFGASPPRVGR
jgi:hypothetical protein